MSAKDPLALFHPAVRDWFERAFGEPTRPQALGWPPVVRGDSTLILAPTGTGKTLAAFLWCLNRLMFAPHPPPRERCRVLYVSPLKALAVDVERNLRAPLAGIAQRAGERGDAHIVPNVAVRTGDTPAAERARFQRAPSDILITTPESLYLLLTSSARTALGSIDTVIVDEIHALVPTKRGAHLALSLERLEALTGRPLQRIGLSATQRPLDEVARFLGGTMPRRPGRARPPRRGRAGPDAGAAAESIHDEFGDESRSFEHRPVTIVDAGARKALELMLEVPVEDMARLSEPVAIPSGPASQGPARPSIWTAIHPRLLELVRGQRSTIIFVNSRRLAERLAGALNELAGETLVRAHHGSIARAQRLDIEDQLKAGTLRGLVATSSLELGIDMGAIDLVVQIEAPPSVASGLQRIGRAGHHVNATSRGVIIPKYRGDLLACAAATRAMHDGHVEATRYPRNPLDVLAQQIVAMVSMERWAVDDLFARVRCAAPFASLSRAIFEGVLDMLSGRYPSDEFAELRPRITWDRVAGTVVGREHARRVAVVNAGTIPDRGLYGVFLSGTDRALGRVGELDEEMVFESRVGETFLLGASTWRIEEITHDRVLVSPAPGEPGKMPFWKADAPGRPLEFGRAIGALVRALDGSPHGAARSRLVRQHGLDERAADNLLQYLRDQKAATAKLPDDRTVVVERCRDELGDWRVCLLSPFGSQVLAPWALAVVAHVREQVGLDVEVMWTDEGFVARFPDTDEPPDPHLLLPPAEEAERLVLRQLGSSALFAAKFRECAGRALLLPRRRPGQRTPLWQQRKRAADLLAVAARHGSFPMLLETYRECLRDVFDLPALASVLRDVTSRATEVVSVETTTPSPFAASLLFGYVANYLYEGDAPLAERRAQALSVDQAQLRELLGGAELRDLLDADAIADVEQQLQHLSERYRAKSVDGLHDLLLRLGDLSRDEAAARVLAHDPDVLTAALVDNRRALWLAVARDRRLVAVEDASRYRDALGIPLPPGLPDALLAPVSDPLGDLARRFARTHGPFTAAELAARYEMGTHAAETVLHRLTATGRLVQGAFRPGGTRTEWCDPDVLGTIRRRSLAKLRREIEPVEASVLARTLTVWQGVTKPRPGLDALLDVVEQLQGAPIAASILEREVLPVRIEGFQPADLDALLAAGEVTWVGLEPLGERDGRIGLFLTDHLPRLCRAATRDDTWPPREQAILEALSDTGAAFFPALHAAAGAGFPNETVDALWNLVWRGLVTNDSLHALRAYVRPAGRERRARPSGQAFRSRRATPPAGEGRWSLLADRLGDGASDTERSMALAQQLLSRHGFVSREVVAAEAIAGGFSAVYDVLKTMEERGRIRRGYFAMGVGAAQFASPAALDLLRSLRAAPEETEVVVLAATDPANAYGSILKWPTPDSPLPLATRGPSRSVGSIVVLVNGTLAVHLGRQGRQLLSFLPSEEPDRSVVGRAVARKLSDLARVGDGRRGLAIADINGGPAPDHHLAAYLVAAGFVPSSIGLQVPSDRLISPREIRPGRTSARLRSSPWSLLRTPPED